MTYVHDAVDLALKHSKALAESSGKWLTLADRISKLRVPPGATARLLPDLGVVWTWRASASDPRPAEASYRVILALAGWSELRAGPKGSRAMTFNVADTDVQAALDAVDRAAELEL